MLSKLIKYSLLILSISAIQIAVIPNLPGNLNLLNFAIIMIVFISFTYGFSLGMGITFCLGLIFDAYSQSIFGLMLIAYVFTLLFSKRIFLHLFTNKSFYALLGLNTIANLFFFIFLLLNKLIYYFVNTENVVQYKTIAIMSSVDFLWQLLFSSILIFGLYFVLNFLSRKYNAAFIDTSKR